MKGFTIFQQQPVYYGPQRGTNEITIYLAEDQPAPISVPPELSGHISRDAWASRIPSITRVASQYNKPNFERAWQFIGMLAIVIVPFALYGLILRTLIAPHDREIEKHYFEARLISFALFAGLILFFLIPIALWKFIGSRRVHRMLSIWAKQDRAAKGPNVEIPVWRVKTPGLFRPTIILSISIPRSRPPSPFHPDAYLPPYINAPSDDYLPAYKRDPNMLGNTGEVPLYTDEKKGFEDISYKV